MRKVRERICTYLRQFTQVPLANALINSKVGLLHVPSYEVEGIGSGQEWEEFILLGLKIQNLWFWFALLDFRLAPHSAVSYGDGASLGQTLSCISHEEGPHKNHGPIRQLVTQRLYICAVRLHLGVFHQHVLSGNTVIVHLQVAVIHLFITKFGTDIPDSDAYHRQQEAL